MEEIKQRLYLKMLDSGYTLNDENYTRSFEWFLIDIDLSYKDKLSVENELSWGYTEGWTAGRSLNKISTFLKYLEILNYEWRKDIKKVI